MKFLSLLLVLIFSKLSHAATFTIYASVTPPFVHKTGEGVAGLSGVFGKIVGDKIIKAGKASEFEVVWVPWKRALAETLKSKNGVFFPIARSAEREKEYAWLGHLGTAESWFYVKNTKVKLNTLQDLKKYRIGYLNGSMRESELYKILGEDAKNLEGLNDDLVNYKKLLSGRIDIWVTQTEVFDKAEADYKYENHKPVKVHAIRKFLDQDIWIVAAAGMNEKLQEKIKVIFQSPEVKPPGPVSGRSPLK